MKRISPAALFLARGDVDGLLAHHRAQFGDLRMEDPPAPPTPPAPPAPAPAPKTFTQDEVNAMLARERTQTQQATAQQLATDLGVTVDEAKQIIADRKAADDAKRTEAERAAEAWKTAQTGAEQIKAAADQERHEAKVERALQRAGIDVENATILTAAMAAVGTQVQVGADDAAIKAAVEKAKTDAPALFAATGGGGGGTHSDPGHPRPTPTPPGGEFGGKGLAEAQRRWGDKNAKTA